MNGTLKLQIEKELKRKNTTNKLNLSFRWKKNKAENCPGWRLKTKRRDRQCRKTTLIRFSQNRQDSQNQERQEKPKIKNSMSTFKQ